MIIVYNTIDVPVEKTWEYWINPKHIIHWNNASDDWHTPYAENDLRVGGSFVYRMEAKDGSFAFDFGGVYDSIIPDEYIEYTLGDSRKVSVKFEADGNKTKVTENFEAETTNTIELQKGGWQAILDNFKRYTEAN